MKRFGVQLAGSGIVVLLGALGVAQAQRDSGSTESTQWEATDAPELDSPPVPIAASEADDTAAEMPGQFGFGGLSSPASSTGSVRTVAHEEDVNPEAGPGAFSPNAFSPGALAPSDTGNEAASAPAATLSLPAWSMPGAAAASAEAPPQQDFQAAAPRDSAAELPPGSESPAMMLPGFGAANAGQPPTDAPSGPANDAAAQTSPETGATGADNTGTGAAYAALPTLQFADAPPNGLRGNEEAAPQAYEAADPQGFAVPAMGATVPDPALPAAENASPMPMTQLSPEADAIPVPATVPETPAYSAAPSNTSLQPEARIASLPQAGTRGLVPLDPTEMDEVVLAEPGDRRLEGIQAPSVVIQKRAPEEVKVGKPASFVIHVRNVGGVEALDVRVLDRVPEGMRLVDASPTPSLQGDLMTWELGALEPGGERTVTMQLIPEREGELGSVARVTFEAAASVRTISTRPELKITQRAPAQVLIGQQLEIEIEVSNPGTGAATGVVLQEDVPEGLDHPKGRQLDNVIGTLAPGEVRRQVLRLRAVAPGQVENHIRLLADDGLQTDDKVLVNVVAPQLAIELEGPSRRFLERQAVFNINLANVGTADATNVEVVAYLDRGFSFVGTEFQGQYDPDRHAVYWSLAELPAEGRGSVPLRLLPIEQGDRAIRLEAKGDLNLVATHEKNVSVDTLSELTFSITDDADPIEVGSEATYEIRISNRGSRDDSDVAMKMLLPAGLELVASEGEASTDGNGLISFAPTAALRAGGETVHRIRVRGVSAGTHIVKAIVTSAQANVPVTKEESTMVYADQ